MIPIIYCALSIPQFPSSSIRVFRLGPVLISSAVQCTRYIWIVIGKLQYHYSLYKNTCWLLVIAISSSSSSSSGISWRWRERDQSLHSRMIIQFEFQIGWSFSRMRIISLAEWQPLQLAHKKWGGVVQTFIFSTMALPCCFVFLFFFCCFKLSSSSSPNYHHHHLHHDDDGMVYTMKQFHEGTYQTWIPR